MDIYFEVDRLINYGVEKKLVNIEDCIYLKNVIFDILKIEGESNSKIIEEKLETPTVVLENITNFAIEKELIQNTGTEIDLFATRLMGVITPRPSEVNAKFKELYKNSKENATQYFYNMSKDCNYIMVDRVRKNLEWDKSTEYGDYKITINVSKPEKTPEEIRKAKLVKGTGYPKCLLCKENVGFSGNLNHPARQNLRTIPITLNEEPWNMQYSPYVYYNEHCIIFNNEHLPMKITTNTIKRLLDFVEIFPHYFIGSNADLPIVGGSILSHDHFQGGHYQLPMAKAKTKKTFESDEFEDVKLSIVNWPMSVIRLNGRNKESLVKVSEKIIDSWKNYSDDSVDIISHTQETEHNTVTPIARINDNGEFELDIVLRNNRTSDEYPDGIFHTHKETHHIKRENIGLIEVMGLGVLPKRLIEEFEYIKKYLNGENTTEFEKENLHYEWVKYLQGKYGVNNDDDALEKIFKEEIGEKFASCLVDCGVFKDTEEGNQAFFRFINSIKFI